MIGAIVLTLRHKAGVKRQDVAVQNARTPAEAVEIRKVPSGRAFEARGQNIATRRRGEKPMTISLTQFLVVAAILFTIGVAGIILNRKNIIVVLMSVELILLSVNINLVAFSAFLGDLTGQVFALFILTVAAAEAAIGLAILVSLLSQPRLDRGRRHQHDEGLSGTCMRQSSYFRCSDF